MDQLIIFVVIMAVMWGIQALLQTLSRNAQPPRRTPPRPGQPPQETPMQSVMRMLEEAQKNAAEQQRRQQEQLRQQEQQRRARAQRVQRQRQPRSQPVLRARPVAPEDHGGELKKHHLRSGVARRQLEPTLAKRRLEPSLAKRRLRHRVHTAGVHGTHAKAQRQADPGEELMQRLERLRPLQRAIALQEILGEPRGVRWMRKRRT